MRSCRRRGGKTSAAASLERMSDKQEGRVEASGHTSGNFNLCWTLKEIRALLQEPGDDVNSSYFCPGDSRVKWSFGIALVEQSGADARIHYFVKTRRDFGFVNAQENDGYCKCVVSLMDTGKQVIHSYVQDDLSLTSCYSKRTSIGKDDLMNRIKDDVLLVTADITYDVFTLTKPLMLRYERMFPDLCWPKISIFDDFAMLLDGAKHSDVVVCVEGKEIPAHKLILMTRSKVFAAMFEHALSEKDSGRVHIDDLGFETVKAMLHFMYTGRIFNLGTPTVLELLRAADKYDIQDLKFFCSNYLVSRMDVGNVSEIMVAADVYDAQWLRSQCINFFLEHVSSFHFSEHRSVMEQRPSLLYDILERIPLLSVKKEPKSLVAETVKVPSMTAETSGTKASAAASSGSAFPTSEVFRFKPPKIT